MTFARTGYLPFSHPTANADTNILVQAVTNVEVNSSETTLEMSQVLAGNYFVTLIFADGIYTTEKIVKL